MTHLTLKLTSLVSVYLIFSSFGFPQNREDSDETKALALIRSWLPYKEDKLALIYEYTATDEGSEQSSRAMHKKIDRAGPTVTMIWAKTAYDDETRIIGGYNPYDWKDWLGRYEQNAGKFVFSLNKEKKWERPYTEPRRHRKSPDRYGLAFGNGDLVINPDLRSGTARNNSFATPGHSSVLVGQSGPFEIERIKIYKVERHRMEESYGPIFRSSLPKEQELFNPSPPYASVPDPSPTLLEISIGFSALIFLRKLLKS